MRLIREEQRVSIAEDGTRAIEGIVRLRGVAANLNWRVPSASGHDEMTVGVLAPQAVIVREDGREQRIDVPRAPSGPTLAAYLAAPALALVAGFLLRKKGR